jgi:hypothetical protein
VSPRRHHPKKRDKKKGGKDRQQEKEKEKEKAVVAAEVSDVDINLSYKEDNNILWKLDLLGTLCLLHLACGAVPSPVFAVPRRR